MKKIAKRLGRDHELALVLWRTGNYEARTVAAYVADPERITPALMDRWCRDFDNWALCDSVCFKLFDRTAHASSKVIEWSSRLAEFEKRAAFALLACLALHDKPAGDELFSHGLRLIEDAFMDERNFVKKAVSWALRAIGRRNIALHILSKSLAEKLAMSTNATARWIGKDALRALVKTTFLTKKKPTTKNHELR